MNRILLVEDDSTIIMSLSAFLKKEGFETDNARGQAEAIEKIKSSAFDLILLDISLKDGNGFSLCREIKNIKNIPVIFLTASGDEYSAVTAFEIGADDFIAKPFRPRELIMRIKNILRLTSSGGSTVNIGNLTVDTEKGTAKKNGEDIFLSALEYKLLLVFINNRGITLTRTRLLDEIWDAGGDFVNDNTLTVYIKRLREKTETDPKNPEIIKTVRGIGYRLD